MSIYFDNAATTAVSSAVAAKILDVMTNEYGNPSSVHRMGARAEREIQLATEKLAEMLIVRPEEMVYTSGGTEANNLAVLGAARAYGREGRHIITSTAEHPSVEQAMKTLEQENFDVTRLPVNEQGFLTAEDVLGALRGDTILVSLIHVNNETGSVLDILDIARRVKKVNPRVLIHTDGVQSFCKCPLDLGDIDLYSMSGHKIHGPKGVGALRVKKGTKLKPLLFGGGQQRNLRPGTENTPGILGMIEAAGECLKNSPAAFARVTEMKTILSALADEMDGVAVNGRLDSRRTSPYILNMSFLGVKGETLVHALAGENIFVSTGAACRSRHDSHNGLKPLGLQPLGLSPERIESAVRFSFSGDNTLEEAQICKEAVSRLARQLRAAVGRRLLHIHSGAM
ncbi:MAG: cysteine desulfurase [Clostridiales bacterium]|jgi:cysteine desulfurase|nr:cysteine desulfurase [Clostridiales bacterium]